ncbi:MAG: AlpA family phage regulatory protein [Azoarcus sp.]|nr:AlpA family phage regulatory protein [Azoarcus sp.]
MPYPRALLRRKDVELRTGISRSALYEKLNPANPRYDAGFPIPVRTGAMSVRWIEGEVDAWIASRPRARIVEGR